MKAVAVLLFVLACSCKGKDKPPAGTASGSAVVAVADAGVVDSAGAAAAPAKMLTDDGNEMAELVIAFEKKIPKLPAVSADGTMIAELTWDTGGGMPPPIVPMHLQIERLDGTGKAEVLELVDDKMSSGEEPWDQKPPDAAVVKVLRERAAAISKRLESGWASLERLELAGEGEPTKLGVGDLTMTATETDDQSLALTLTRAGKVVRRRTIAAYASDEKPPDFDGGSCSYRPFVGDTFLDQAKQTAYVAVRFRFNEMCTEQPITWVVWPLTGEDPDPAAAFAKDAVRIDRSTVAPATTKPETGTDIAVTTSSDGKSAWASLVAADKSRASYVLAMTADGWRVIAVTSTKAVANAAANRDAKSGKLKPPPAFTAEVGDGGLRAAFTKLANEGLTKPRDELVAFGSGPGERTTTGAALAKGWNAGWKGKTTITSSIARVTPSGNTGWVAANVELAKPGYKIPFAIFAIFDKASSGEWTLVHLHFSV